MKTNKELDVLKIRVAIEVFGWKETDKRLPDHDPNWISYEAPWYETPDGEIEHYTNIPDYPRKIKDAWLVHKEMVGRLFSVRQRYYRALQRSVYEQRDFMVAWPDVMTFLEPEHFCLAALESVKDKP